MRNTILGIIVGIVLGIMAGATIIAPGLKEAMVPPTKTPNTPKSKNHTQPSQALNKASSTFRIVSQFTAKDTLMTDIGHHLQNTINKSGDRTIRFELFTPNMLIPQQDTFNAVRSGTIEAAFASTDQLNLNSLALQLFTAVPFGPDATEFTAWFYHGGGQALFEQQFQRRGVHALLCGVLPASGSGWYKAPIRNLDDFKGLRIRTQGLSRHVLEKSGASIQTMDLKETLSSLKNGQLDGAEYALPSMDQALGFSRLAKNYYFPSWQQPSRLISLIINVKAWERLSPKMVDSVENSCRINVQFSLTLANSKQFKTLQELALSGVRIHQWPVPILMTFKKNWQRSVRTLSQQDPAFKVIWKSLRQFRQDYSIWYEISHLQVLP